MKVLDKMPSDLDELFKSILSSFDEGYQKKTYQTPALIRLAKSGGLDMTLFAFLFLDEYESDAGFAKDHDVELEFPFGSIKGITVSDAEKHLRGTCGGLVELQHRRDNGYVGQAQYTRSLDYSHRSIPDIFEKGDIKRDMARTLMDFDPVDALTELRFLELCAFGKFHRQWPSEFDMLHGQWTRSVSLANTDPRLGSGFQEVLGQFLRSMDF